MVFSACEIKRLCKAGDLQMVDQSIDECPTVLNLRYVDILIRPMGLQDAARAAYDAGYINLL